MSYNLKIYSSIGFHEVEKNFLVSLYPHFYVLTRIFLMYKICIAYYNYILNNENILYLSRTLFLEMEKIKMLGVGVNTRMETTEKVDLNELQKSVQQEAENAIRWQVNTDVRLLFCSMFFLFHPNNYVEASEPKCVKCDDF